MALKDAVLVFFNMVLLKIVTCFSDVSTEDAGLYTCIATSSRGMTKATAFVSIVNPGSQIPIVRAKDPEAAPGPPATPTAKYKNSTTVHLSWAPSNHIGASEVTSYVVEYYSSGERVWRKVSEVIKSSPFILSGLDPDHTYGVTVRARNAYGVSEPSGIVEIADGESFDTGITFIPPEIAKRLEKTKVILREAKSVASTSAKIVWQVSMKTIIFYFFIIKAFSNVN